MDSGIVAAIALLLLLAGAVVLLAWQRMIPFSLPSVKTPAGSDRDNGSEPAVPRSAAPGPRVEPLRLDVVPTAPETVATRLDRIEERLDHLHRAVVVQGDLRAELRRVAAELATRAEAEAARRETALERMRGDLLTSVASMAVEGRTGSSDRRANACAELYARLARLETALAAVTNPILLPGEPYAPPAEFRPEAVVWENWNEVGERAFAFADTFSAQRLFFSPQTRAELDGFVISLRAILTRSIYPNLQPDADTAQHAALRAALESLAREFPKARDTIERAYRLEVPGST